ncbi:MAG TPA: glycogen debranching enzyme, partial [Actinomycetota bacterium]|nr:glycogen debranching enzyme [Actinomycetota bacterium]
YDWESVDEDLLEFTRSLVRFRLDHPVFRRRRFFEGRPIHGADVADIGWFRPDGSQMSDEDWDVGFAKSLGVFLNGETIPTPDSRGQRIEDDSFLVLFNASHEDVKFTLPGGAWGSVWEIEIDTAAPTEPDVVLKSGDVVELVARSVQVLKRA